jgi:hypothetical protein
VATYSALQTGKPQVGANDRSPLPVVYANENRRKIYFINLSSYGSPMEEKFKFLATQFKTNGVSLEMEIT